MSRGRSGYRKRSKRRSGYRKRTQRRSGCRTRSRRRSVQRRFRGDPPSENPTQTPVRLTFGQTNDANAKVVTVGVYPQGEETLQSVQRYENAVLNAFMVNNYFLEDTKDGQDITGNPFSVTSFQTQRPPLQFDVVVNACMSHLRNEFGGTYSVEVENDRFKSYWITARADDVHLR